MQDLRKGDVVVSMFPFAEGHAAKVRPAVVCAGPWVVGGFSVCWILMVTSSARRHWPGDVEISDIAIAGLPSASLVRPLKIACVDTQNIMQRMGTLDAKTLRAVEKQVRIHLKRV